MLKKEPAPLIIKKSITVLVNRLGNKTFQLDDETKETVDKVPYIISIQVGHLKSGDKGNVMFALLQIGEVCIDEEQNEQYVTLDAIDGSLTEELNSLRESLEKNFAVRFDYGAGVDVLLAQASSPRKVEYLSRQSSGSTSPRLKKS